MLENSTVYDIEVDFNICCDVCHEITNNYIEQCPICKNEYVDIDESGSLNQNKIEIIECEKCNTHFKLITSDWYGYDEDAKVVVVDAPKPIIKEEITTKIDPQIEEANKKRIEAFRNYRWFEPLI